MNYTSIQVFNVYVFLIYKTVVNISIIQRLLSLMEILKQQFGSISALARSIISPEQSLTTVMVPFEFILNLVSTRSVCLKQVNSERIHRILKNVLGNNGLDWGSG